MERATIIALTQCVRLYRLLRRFEDDTGNLTMPIKWNITGQATEARGNMDAISRAYKKLNENARIHRADVEGIASQVVDMQTDLEHAANVLGNGGQSSDEPTTEPPQTASTPHLNAMEAPVVSGATFHGS